VANDGTVIATGLDKHGRSDGTAAILEKQFGNGKAILICVDLPGTVVRIQQGICVTRDGVAARDGSAPIDDSVLKSGDGGVLDWYFDRDEVPGVPGLNAFLRPQADAWREILVRSICYLAGEKKMPVYVLWMWPRNLPAIGHISHDSDGNEPDMAELLLASLNRAGIKSTWCIIPPGYSPPMIERIRSAGHELAMHYDAMTPGLPWGEDQFEKQWQELRNLLGQEIITNKNHYLRWQGDMDFFAWCEKRGIQLDQSKGPSKTGEAGFNFGTSHPYFPISFDGQLSPVLELTTHTQDLGIFAPESLGRPLLLAALKHHGVAHFLFHPAHFGKPQTAPAMEAIVRLGKEHGMEWWTSRQINDWVRARRTVRWQFDSANTITMTAKTDLSQVTVLCLATTSDTKVNDQPFTTATVRRWGFDFASVILDIPSRSVHEH
jgi:peptidoglycan/xylan/chitin deacetylase (PgdA/CDA1 family)